MVELEKHLEKKVITPNLRIDEEIVFDLPVINYIDDSGNHWLTDGIGGNAVVIERDNWETFINNLYTIRYRKSVLGDKIAIREKLDPLEWKREYLYQLVDNHQPNYADHTRKFLETRKLHSMMKIRRIEVIKVD